MCLENDTIRHVELGFLRILVLVKKEVFVLYCTCHRVDAGCLANLVVLVTLYVFNQDSVLLNLPATVLLSVA